MPAMGESVSEGVILEWAKQPGDTVAEDETIVEISTDKVDAEVPAPASGVMGEILAQPGDTVNVGQVIGRMTSGPNGSTAAVAPDPVPKPADAEVEQPEEVVSPDGIRISPVARRVAQAEGVDVSDVQGQRPRRPHPQGRRPRRRVNGNGAGRGRARGD